MDLLEGIWTRRSIREYTDDTVEFEKLTAICEAGMCAPSSGNVQNWRFIVVRDKEKIQEGIANACVDQECVQDAEAMIVVCADEQLCEREYGLRGKRLYSIQNCAAATQNMLLAAHGLGLGATWVGAFNEERLDSLLDIPDIARVQALITLGYPDEEPGEKRMRHIDHICSFETYGMQYKDLHRVMKDMSVEWQKQAERAQESLSKTAKEYLDKAKEWFDELR